MHSAVALLGLACAGTLVLSMRTGIAAALMAWAMVSLWAGSNLMWIAGASDLLPLMTLPIACASFALWYEEREEWQRVLLAILAGRMLLHCSHPTMGSPEEAVHFHLLNATYLAALVAISWKGGADAIGDCLRGLRRLRSLLAADSRSSFAAEIARVD